MNSTTKRLSVTLDTRTLEEAMRLSGSRTQRETISKALQELVKVHLRRALAEELGSGAFETTEEQLRRRRKQSHARR